MAVTVRFFCVLRGTRLERTIKMTVPADQTKRRCDSTPSHNTAATLVLVLPDRSLRKFARSTPIYHMETYGLWRAFAPFNRWSAFYFRFLLIFCSLKLVPGQRKIERPFHVSRVVPLSSGARAVWMASRPIVLRTGDYPTEQKDLVSITSNFF